MRIATIGPSGPHNVPYWYTWYDGRIWFNTTLGNLAVRNAERDPRASATVDDGEIYEELRGVTINGMIEMVPRTDPQIEGVETALSDAVPGRQPGAVRQLAQPPVVRPEPRAGQLVGLPEDPRRPGPARGREGRRNRRRPGRGLSAVPSIITVRGIQAEGRHGANPGERNEAQPFVVDVEVSVDARRDSIDATADYGAIADAVRETVAGTSFELVETLALEVARSVFGLPWVERSTVVIHKPRAAEIIGAEDVAVEVTVQ